MISYAAIETAVLAKVQAMPELDAVKRFERTVRVALFGESTLTQGFKAEELPAINLRCDGEPVKCEPWTTGEMAYRVLVEVYVICRDQDKTAAKAEMLTYRAAIEKALNRCRKSDSLGTNCLVTGTMTSSDMLLQESPHHFAIGQVTVEVLKIVEV